MINNILSNDRTKSTTRTDKNISHNSGSDNSDDEDSVEIRANIGGNRRNFGDDKFDCTVIASGTLRHIHSTYNYSLASTVTYWQLLMYLE